MIRSTNCCERAPPAKSQFKGAAYHVAILVLPGATELDLTLHQELFRVANGLLNSQLFRVELLTVDNQCVALANGRVIQPTSILQETSNFSLSVVLSHVNPSTAALPAIHATIRKLAKASLLIAAADQAPMLLASAGLLDGRVATCHVDLMLAAREGYPAVEFIDQLRVRDGDILTYPGHLSTVDAMVDHVGGMLGAEFAEMLSAEFISAPPRPSHSPQRTPDGSPAGTRDQRVLRAIDLRRANIETPLSIPAIAERVGISTRSLESLWRNALGASPQSFYLRERISHSCSLLLFSKLSITEISCACGFGSGTSFSRAFSDLTGLSPREYRRQHGNKIAPAVLLTERSALRTDRLAVADACVSGLFNPPKITGSS